MRMLVVDDDCATRRQLVYIARELPEVEVLEAASQKDAHALLERRSIDVALIDLRLDAADPDNRDGLALVREVRARAATPIVVSGSDGMHDVRQAMRFGAHDYLLKEELSSDLVLPILRRLCNQRVLEKEVITLRSKRFPSPMDSLIGPSAAMQRLRDVLQRVSLSDRPVLVTGPTGAGKELAVRAIHALGSHPDEPFLDLNCGAFPESLIESQLFGHERGAFTGADRKQQGFFTAVGRGTLFLDEIAELPLELQAKLLRVLETKTYRPVGASQTRVFEGRVIAATHADLEERVSRGLFREDLFYRLNVLEVTVPSLDERRDDIPALIAHFSAKQTQPLEFTAAAIEMLRDVPWPGNVRQLRNLVDRLAVFTESVVTPELIVSLAGRSKQKEGAALAGLIRAVLRLPDADKLQLMTTALVDEAMRLSDGNKTAAARLLGVHRKVVERCLSRTEATSHQNA
ncbi:sigma-54 dependent transcriptional regulator [Pendulispora brunnea]|uniref:Sigma-54 dependent transcriptional regulator n=1 Tax=Pendulispora brunnea TaxID=2905690 RepID=A0ABZ2KGI1_9BACT